MNRAIKAVVFFFVTVMLATACTKIDTTTLGSEVIPDVDNIHTFDTVLEVNAYNDIPGDSTRIFYNDPHLVGAINSDPYFGSSNSTLFFEMRPTSYPFLMSVDSIIKFDSAVLVLNYGGYYGDSASPLNLKLYEVDKTMYPDTSALPYYNFQPGLQANTGKLWGQKTMQANRFKDTMAIKLGDSVYKKVTNQLRIPLTQSLASALFSQDTTVNGAYYSDSTFKAYLKGFALQAEGASQAMFYLALNNSDSKIEFYFQTVIRSTGAKDTAVQSYGFSTRCGHAMKFDRNRTGSEIMNYLNPDPVKGSEQLYVQAAPGTVAKIKIPGLSTLSNRVIHRAELRVTELTPNASSAHPQLVAPQVLYLDVADSNNVFRGIPYDMSPLKNYYCYPTAGIEYGYFGGVSRTEMVNGEELNVYRFNLSRYIQGIITRKEWMYELRLSAPYYLDYKNCYHSSASYPSSFFMLQTSDGTIANYPGDGRVRLAGSKHADPNKKMQLRIVYSKL
ncbi:MAG TPA: DUF4270 family protein [Phnomibacter sp.]|nr:DUF4270 family protein [Phnomibacter sp.]